MNIFIWLLEQSLWYRKKCVNEKEKVEECVADFMSNLPKFKISLNSNYSLSIVFYEMLREEFYNLYALG